MSETQDDKFSKSFFFLVPGSVPLFVTFATFAFYPFVSTDFIWLPLLLIYWGTIWGYSLFYWKKRGGVFEKERYKLTLKLKGKYLWLQYLVVYAPLLWAVPLFIINYSMKLSLLMYITLIVASAINGPTEELFWRACMDDAGKNAGISERGRLLFAPIAFSLWHTAFIIHLIPWDKNWFTFWIGIIIMTWFSGFIWHWVMHRSERLVPQSFYHACANFLNIFPMILVTIMALYF
ncbi:MAG: CPBP family glutamic-type intramembrane protease [Promethearchaeota archaeon]